MRKIQEMTAKDDCQRVTVEQAAKEIGCFPQYLRNKMKAKEWDLGRVVNSKKPNGQSTYFIFREKLDRFLGKEPA